MAVKTGAPSAKMSGVSALADTPSDDVSSFPTAPAPAGAHHFPGHSSVET